MATPQATASPGNVSGPRHVKQLHLSTALVLTLVAGILIGLNLIPAIGRDERQYGWPFPVVRFLGELPATIRSDWPLWFNLVGNLLILLYSAVIWEHLIRRRVAHSRVIQPTTTFFAAFASTILIFLTFFPRAPKSPIRGQLCGWPLVIYRDVHYEFEGSKTEWAAIHSADKDVILRELGAYYYSYFAQSASDDQFHIVLSNTPQDTSRTNILLQADILADVLLVVTAAIFAEWLAIRKARSVAKNRMDLVSAPNINPQSV